MSLTSFADRLRDMAKGSATIDIAQFQFIDLAEVERAYGERWPTQKVRIHEIAHAYLSKRLGPADVLIKGGGGFIVVSGAVSGQEASVAAANLAHGLNNYFLGEIAEVPPPRIGVESHKVEVARLAETLGGVLFVEMDSSISDKQPTVLSQTDWRYQPVWDVKREALGSYYLVPYLKASGTRLPGYQFETMSGPPQSFVAVDDASLWASEQALRELFDKEGRAFVGAAVHSSSLTNLVSRARLLKAMEHFDQTLLRYKTIKIANVMPGFPRIYLREILNVLKQRVPNIVLSAAWDEPDVQGLVASDPVAVGLALPASVIGSGSSISSANLLSRIRAAVQIAHAAKKNFFVEGPISRELAAQLIAAGVDNISSPRIWPKCSAPETVTKWPAARLLVA